MLLEQVYPGDTFPQKLEAMNEDLRTFCTSKRKQIHFKFLTRDFFWDLYPTTSILRDIGTRRATPQCSWNSFSGFFSNMQPRWVNLACYRLCLRQAKQWDSLCGSFLGLRFGFRWSKHTEPDRHPYTFYNAMQSWSKSFTRRRIASTIWCRNYTICII